MGAEAIPGKSQGHHPAGHRPANPTRAYESGSDGYRRHAAPARHPCPPRSPPGKANPGNPMPSPPDCPGGRNPGVKGACGVATRALRAPVTARTVRVIWQRSRPWGQTGTPCTRHLNQARPSHNTTNQAQKQQKLDGPLHMRSLFRTVPGACPGAPAAAGLRQGRACIQMTAGRRRYRRQANGVLLKRSAVMRPGQLVLVRPTADAG